MRKIATTICLFLSFDCIAQHDHPSVDASTQSHLSHIQANRSQTVYIHDLPPPPVMDGIGTPGLKIQTTSEKTQTYFSQGITLLHDFWDLEAYRAFKEAIRNDSSAIMPYWGLLQTLGPMEDSGYKKAKQSALKQLKALLPKASEHEKLYALSALVIDSLPDKGYEESTKKLELIVHKYPEDVDAKLFLALRKMSGYDVDLNPNEGQLYSEYLLKDLFKTHPTHHALHHYWIHLKENCCPEQALESAKILTSLAPKSGHIVHMPGHIYYKLGDYKKAHDAFVAAVAVDSAYMKQQGIQAVDDWNYIHNINYLLASCAQDGRYKEGLYYAEKLKNMPVSKDRKKVYDGTFFYQGILAPAKMEMAFGFWDRSVKQLEAIQDNDTVFSAQGMEFKKALTAFVQGMASVKRNKLTEAMAHSNELDALLWRNEYQSGKDSIIRKYLQNNLNTASMELQGCIMALQGKFDQAVMLLERALKKEKELGYGEPPSYARPVGMSLAWAYERANRLDKAIEAYEVLLKHRPNSAYVLHGLRNAYQRKGDPKKANEYEVKLKEAGQYGDKGIYATKY